MTPDTWGIPGPTFLACYVAAIAVVGIAAFVHRRRLTAGDADAVAHLHPQQVAYLAGGEQLAIYSALAGLRMAEAIGRVPVRKLAQTGPLPAGATSLDVAIHHAAARGLRARSLPREQPVTAALAQLREGLEQRGLVVTATQQRAVRLWAVPALALVALGAVRMVAGAQNGKPIDFLIIAIVVAVVVAIRELVAGAPTTTRGARTGLARLRRDNHYLAPHQSPAYETYGIAGAAMGVALFGGASLYELDPAFASEMQIRRAAVYGGSSSSSSSSCSGSYNYDSGSSSSCGGSSSSCGSSSSSSGCGG